MNYQLVRPMEDRANRIIKTGLSYNMKLNKMTNPWLLKD